MFFVSKASTFKRNQVINVPKSTFLNLPPAKKKAVEDVLLEVFYNRHVAQVKVSEIVTGMGMARGSFYKYFEDLEDAHLYMIKRASAQVHQAILTAISEEQEDFFRGIEAYLIGVLQLERKDNEWKMIKLLTQSSDVFAKRLAPTDALEEHVLTAWTGLLEKNRIVMADKAESLAFLYLMMDLVMNELTAAVVNNWDVQTLKTDYRFREKWLKNGLSL